jgi:hypothetical protein
VDAETALETVTVAHEARLAQTLAAAKEELAWAEEQHAKKKAQQAVGGARSALRPPSDAWQLTSLDLWWPWCPWCPWCMWCPWWSWCPWLLC